MVMLHLSFFSWMNQTLSQQRVWWEKEMNTKEVSNLAIKMCFSRQNKVHFGLKHFREYDNVIDAYEKKIFVKK